jgi:hypothetical protein
MAGEPARTCVDRAPRPWINPDQHPCGPGGDFAPATVAVVLLIAPTAYHRLLFRLGDKEHLVNVANRFTLAGLACVAFSMVGAILLVTDLLYDGPLVATTSVLAATGCFLAWCVAPLRRRWRLRGRGPRS